VTGLWFSPGTPVPSTNKTDCHDIAEILLKVALSTIILSLLIWLQIHDSNGQALDFPVIFNFHILGFNKFSLIR
jgi:hypothetical protein